MARLMAIDYGTKRVGIAVTDTLQIIATGLTTIKPEELIRFIEEYAHKEPLEALIIGESKNWSNQDNEIEKHIQSFMSKLGKVLPDLSIKRVDERFTSSLALDSLIQGGVKKKERRKKELLDEVSATIILQTYLSKEQKL